MVCTTPRTGGNWLDARMTELGLGWPQEWLRLLRVQQLQGADVMQMATIRWLWAHRGVNGIFGIKVHWNEARYGLRFIDLLPPGPRLYVHLVRHDVGAQARSWALAREYGTFFTRPRWDMVPRPACVAAARAHIVEQNTLWRAWFAEHGITALPIAYEDMLVDQDGVIEAICAAADARCVTPTQRRAALRSTPLWETRARLAPSRLREPDVVGDCPDFEITAIH